MAGEEKVRALLAEMRGLRAAREDLAWLKDRQAIRGIINRQAHATDRHDWDMLINEIYWPDALADHDSVVGSPQVVAAHIGPNYVNRYQTHCHVTGNHICEIDGNTAHTETYVTGWGLAKDGKTMRCSHARYIDRLEKRPDKDEIPEWRIVLHRIVVDMRGVIDAIQAPVKVTGTWDHDDPSCHRPMRLPREKLAILHR